MSEEGEELTRMWAYWLVTHVTSAVALPLVSCHLLSHWNNVCSRNIIKIMGPSFNNYWGTVGLYFLAIWFKKKISLKYFLNVSISHYVINKDVFVGINRNLLLSLLLLIVILFITSLLTNYMCRSKTRVQVLSLKNSFSFGNNYY